jgi:competence protein ComEA
MAVLGRSGALVSQCETRGRHASLAAARAIIESMTRATLSMLVFAIALAGLTAAAMLPAFAQTPQSASHLRAPRYGEQAGGQAGLAQDPFPESAGKPVLLKVCSNCHAAETVIQSLRTRQEWSDVIDQMARFGAEASDQEFDQILTYLSRHFSPIKVNKAAAKDLESFLDVPAAVAEAIVDYRSKNGDFKTLDDLKRMPGLDADRIEARKARIVF